MTQVCPEASPAHSFVFVTLAGCNHRDAAVGGMASSSVLSSTAVHAIIVISVSFLLLQVGVVVVDQV